ncbi:MAG: putative 4-hydroxybenzoate polyprenyltransferase [Thermodesulfovibrionales bacterium]|nr:putative 4-hydroxybenzoate polyprenyltransferase [Thermodesulfovibrionales bacterium]
MFKKIALYLSMIKFSHSIFALPFALTSTILASNGLPPLRETILIILAMVSARSLAMGLNRLIDKDIDALNPRTSKRELPTGRIKVVEVVIFIMVSLILFIFSAYMLNELCLKLAPVALIFIFVYSYTKRFTWLCHIVLGICISAAPVGAWIAIKGTFNWEILPLSIAVVFWLAGFDILYALQDIDFDKRYGLYSIPNRFGISKSLWISRTFHLITFLMLVLTGIVFNLSTLYWIGMVVVLLLFVYEHSLVKKDDLSRLNLAFFNMNGYISIIVFLSTSLSLM